MGRIANSSPKLIQSGANPKSIFSGNKRERVGGWECPDKRDKSDFWKHLNFWDGQANIGDSTIDSNVLKERQPSKKHSETDTNSAISGKVSDNYGVRRK